GTTSRPHKHCSTPEASRVAGAPARTRTVWSSTPPRPTSRPWTTVSPTSTYASKSVTSPAPRPGIVSLSPTPHRYWWSTTPHHTRGHRRCNAPPRDTTPCAARTHRSRPHLAPEENAPVPTEPKPSSPEPGAFSGRLLFRAATLQPRAA